MKTIIINMFAAVATFLLLTGCEHENIDRQHYDNKLFISASAFTDEMLIEEKTDGYSRQLVAGIAKPESHDIEVSFRLAPELLDAYRKGYYDENAIVLPEENCRIEEPNTVILAGNVQSAPVMIEFLKTSSLDSDQRYVMPVSIDLVKGVGEVLRSARTYYFLFRGAALINIVADLTENRAWPEWGDFDEVRDMRSFTMEALINPNALTKPISTIMGIEDKFLIRIGDSGISSSQIQIVGSYGEKLTDKSLQLETGVWTHVAVTFNCIEEMKSEIKVYLNGELKKAGEFRTSSVDFAIPHSNESGSSITRCFWVGYSFISDRYFDGKFSEVRVWNRALSQEEIVSKNHFYQVDPSSEGLVAYWKFNDAAGSVAKDYSQYGNDLTIESEPTWTQVELPAPVQ